MYVKGGNKYYRVDLRSKHYLGPQAKDFNDRAKALKHAAEIAERVAKLGVNSVTVVNDPRVKPWTDECSVYGHTVEDAISTAIGVWRKQKEAQESPFIEKLLSVWVQHKIVGVKKLRPKSSRPKGVLGCGRNRSRLVDLNAVMPTDPRQRTPPAAISGRLTGLPVHAAGCCLFFRHPKPGLMRPSLAQTVKLLCPGDGIGHCVLPVDDN
jgi:hypothetical protein